jgi:hypothetical protein
MRNTSNRSTLGRAVAGLVMGGLTLALDGLSAAFGPIGLAAVIGAKSGPALTRCAVFRSRGSSVIAGHSL